MFTGILEKAASKVAETFLGEVFDGVNKIFATYMKGEISEDQVQMKLAELKSKTTTEFHKNSIELQKTMVQSSDPFVRRAVPAAFWSTLFIQVWYSFIQPLGVAVFGEWFPVLKPGDTVEWNFILLLGLLGLHPSGLIGQVKGLLKGK